MENQIYKKNLRDLFKRKRGNLTLERQKTAAKGLFCHFKESAGLTLSYTHFGSELSTYSLNLHLALQNNLVLPKMVGNGLRLFRVKNPLRDLLGTKLLEPDPTLCEEVSISDLNRIFVPALAFDQQGYRIGYGKGYYDRLLASLPPSLPTIGIGFHEQLSLTPLPIESHDIAVQRLSFF